MTAKPRTVVNVFARRPFAAQCPTCLESMSMVTERELDFWVLQHLADGCEPPA